MGCIRETPECAPLELPLRLPHTWQEMKTLSLRSEDKAEVAPDELGLSLSLLSLLGEHPAHFSFLMQVGGGTDHRWPGQQGVGEDGRRRCNHYPAALAPASPHRLLRPLLVPDPVRGGRGPALPVLFSDCQGFIFGFSPQRGPQGRLKDKQGFKSWS